MSFLFRFIIKAVAEHPLSCLAAVAIWVACLMPIPETPLENVRFIDKYVHILMYACLCMLVWGEYFYLHKHTKPTTLLIGTVLIPIAMGGLVELAQAFCTGGRRSGDWLDFAADVVGVAVAAIIGLAIYILLARRRAKDDKD